MPNYTILTDGIQTHQLHADELPKSTDAFKAITRGLTLSSAKYGQVVEVVSLMEGCEERLGKRCPQIGQTFPTLAEAARFIGANVQSLYRSGMRRSRKENGCYAIFGVEMGFCAKKRSPAPLCSVV